MELSIVIPAYNEEGRLPTTLDRILNYLIHNFHDNYEIIVVNDGSTDGTSSVVREYIKKDAAVFSLLDLPVNRGRGAAVREGVKTAQGDYILETDADGSVDEEAILRFYNILKTDNDIDVLIGSRNAPGAKILTRQSFLRVFLGFVFIYLARLFFGFYSTDYALGFKMFKRDAANDVFSHQIDDHFLAEAEVLFVAKKRGWRVKELPVFWTDFRNSKVHPFRESARSLIGLGKIMLRYKRGFYNGPKK